MTVRDGTNAEQNPLLALARTKTSAPGYVSVVDEFVDTLPDDDAANVRQLLAEPTIGHHAVHTAILDVFAANPVIASGEFTQGKVADYRRNRGIRIRRT